MQNQHGELFIRRFDKEGHDNIIKTKKERSNFILEPFDVVEQKLKAKQQSCYH